MIKSLIKQRFSKSLKSYNKCAIVQKQMAHNLFDMIENNSYNNILELGCGTGFVTRLEAFVDMLSRKKMKAKLLQKSEKKTVTKLEERKKEEKVLTKV